jgi:hypothetical protein
MHRTGFFHHIGTFLLLVACALLIVTDISAPVVNDIGMLRVDLANGTNDAHTALTFGTFGYCVIDVASGPDVCSPRAVGYSPLTVMANVDGYSDSRFSDYAKSSTTSLTKVMILHPIATAFSFIAFILGIGAGMVGSFTAALVSLVAFIITVVALICDFVLWSVVKDNIGNQNTGSYAFYSYATWTLLVAAICQLLGTIVIFFTCCSARLHRQTTTSKGDGTMDAPAQRRRRWW